MPQMVCPNNDIKSLVEYFINDYGHKLQHKKLQFKNKIATGKAKIHFLNVELIKIKLLEKN